MKKEMFKVFIGVFLIIQAVLLFYLIQLSTSTRNNVSINEIIQYTQLHWSDKDFDIQSYPDVNYTIIDDVGNVLYQSNDTTSKTLEEAQLHQDTIIDIVVQNEMVGKVLILNETDVVVSQMKERFLIVYFMSLLSFVVMLFVYYWYVRTLVFTPFRQLKSFAIRVANGNFDIPLPMDRYHAFGAFSESFDLMRDELKKAKEEEAKAKQDKKELIAKLSHDIKTPVASIKAISELMRVQATSSKVQDQVDMINKKADQIDQLISDLFHATLEELQQLSVCPVELVAQDIQDMLGYADYLGKANQIEFPDCLLLADPLRLQQVIDNIVNNSYKYADTKIEFSAQVKDDYLVIDIKDHGQDAQWLTVTMLCEKFYRDKNANGKSGAGLGLFISKYFMEQMQGSLSCDANQEGFCVHLYIKLAS